MEPISNSPNCFVCAKPNQHPSTPLMKCSRCMTIFYCSLAHQKQDWNRHKVECSTLGNRVTQAPPAQTPLASKRPKKLTMRQQNELQKNLEKAEVLRKSKNHAEALRLYQEIAEILQAPSSANVGMGICYLNLKEYEKGLEQFNQVLSINPKNEDCLLNRAGILIASGRLEEAKIDILQLSVINKFSPGVPTLLEHYNLAVRKNLIEKGLEAYKQTRNEEALKRFEEAKAFELKLNINEVMTTLLIGLCYSRLDQHEKAIDYLEQPLDDAKIVTENWLILDVFMYRALSKLNLNRIEEARADIDAIKKLDPKNIAISFLTGNAFEKEQKYQEALEYYLKLYQSDIAFEKLFSKEKMIHIAHYIDNKLLAERCLDQILQDDPNSYQALEAKGTLYVLRNNAAEARNYFDKSIEICDTYYGSLARRANLNMDQGRFEEAEVDCARALGLVKNGGHNYDQEIIENLYLDIFNKKQCCEDALTLLKLSSGIQSSTVNIPNFAAQPD